jgi:cyclopropane fatty-acyl-phospholipid synthase-like methyltransferase
MLNEMNRQIFSRLDTHTKGNFADLGCGMGGTMRYGLKHYNNLQIEGVTLSDFQAVEGNKMLRGLNSSIRIEDYNNTTFNSNSLDGAFAIESFCHGGHNRASFAEAYRILKPGARLVVADAFLKKEIKDLCPGGSYCYKKPQRYRL